MDKIINLALTRKQMLINMDVVQYATAPKIIFVCEDFIPSGTAEIYIEKPSGLKTYTACTIVDNKIIFAPTTQAFAEAGKSKCQLQITGSEGNAISFIINANVEPCIIDSEAVESENEFTALQEALNTVGAYNQRIDALENKTQGQSASDNVTTFGNLEASKIVVPDKFDTGTFLQEVRNFNGSTPAAVSVPSGTTTYTTVANFTLPKGLYLILATASFTANANGIRVMILSETENGVTNMYNQNRVSQNASITGTSHIRLFTMLRIDNDTQDVYVNVAQTSGATLNATPRLAIMRLK